MGSKVNSEKILDKLKFLKYIEIDFEERRCLKGKLAIVKDLLTFSFDFRIIAFGKNISLKLLWRRD